MGVSSCTGPICEEGALVCLAVCGGGVLRLGGAKGSSSTFAVEEYKHSA